jgi:hypothetical protein
MERDAPPCRPAPTSREPALRLLHRCTPQVVGDARRQAATSSSCWSYHGCGVLCQQSGSGNNWAMGYNKHGPAVREGLMDLVRKEVSAASAAAAAHPTRHWCWGDVPLQHAGCFFLGGAAAAAVAALVLAAGVRLATRMAIHSCCSRQRRQPFLGRPTPLLRAAGAGGGV